MYPSARLMLAYYASTPRLILYFSTRLLLVYSFATDLLIVYLSSAILLLVYSPATRLLIYSYTHRLPVYSSTHLPNRLLHYFTAHPLLICSPTTHLLVHYSSARPLIIYSSTAHLLVHHSSARPLLVYDCTRLRYTHLLMYSCCIADGLTTRQLHPEPVHDDEVGREGRKERGHLQQDGGRALRGEVHHQDRATDVLGLRPAVSLVFVGGWVGG